MHIRESNLRRLAQERLNSGELPPVQPGLTRDVTATGLPCALCGAPVIFEEVDCQLPGDVRTRNFRFHLTCHTVWTTASIT
jgi:hypothetical protein